MAATLYGQAGAAVCIKSIGPLVYEGEIRGSPRQTEMTVR